VSRLADISFLAPFQVRSFRFQWPADLLTSWAFEMETLILGWYVLVETESVLLLTVFASLQFVGTLVSPMFGVIGDRIGRRVVLCSMRGIYAFLATILMSLGLMGALQPTYVFAVAFLAGLVRPSDLVLRYVLIGDTMPGSRVVNAMGLSRMTQDTARIAGALAGAGLFATLGIGAAYIFIAAFYVMSFALTFGVSKAYPGNTGGAARAAARQSRWRELGEGLAYVWNTPKVLALMWLAFLVNLTAYPFSMGLLPYVAKDIYGIDETGLGHLVAGIAGGALIGSVTMVLSGGRWHSTRWMVVNILVWYVLLAIFASTGTMAGGFAALFVMGIVQSMAMITMASALLRASSDRFRARVMGVRMLAVYGLPIGLLASGPAIERFGFTATLWICVAVGIVFTVLIGYRWRAAIWH
jgi:MFS family permease